MTTTAAAALLGAVAVWRSPSVALLRLKLAVDRHDLTAVERIVDLQALTDAALARLVEERPGEAEHIRLALHGRGGWLPAVTSARDYLRIRLGRAVERLVEEPESALHVSWADLRASLATLERSGATASFAFRAAAAAADEYQVRMRRVGGGWRIVAVERDGDPALLRRLGPEPAPEALPPAPAAAANDPAPGTSTPVAEERFAMALDDAATLARTTPVPKPRGLSLRPFARRLDAGTWTVQVGSTTDAAEAEIEREWFAELGEPAFVSPAEVRGQSWQRVLIGRYSTFAEAERSAARLTEQLARDERAR